MKPIHILLVEDNEGDIFMTREAFEDFKIKNKISVARDGKEAIDFLLKENKYKEIEDPDLVILDINLPKKSGHEVLKSIKENPKTQHIPVIMLSTSSSEKDITLSYQNRANCYITKPVEADEFMKAITSIEEFWLSIVSLPPVK
ncbi:response regulator [Aquiflexum gelatinilyticum]|uniref:Response regulator n=1 Tax=Aquiflexum gelatinilyticum TaxID=2961943 RepID=A0A9X2P6N8_9BACT|nr:response regulator [Aquiflexum gelatinilyticum]MCR9014114.1 response regulator [Aquiflexum gelatinilyticum]